MRTSIREAAGSLLVVGLNSTELTGLERAWLRLVRPGGVILFKRNVINMVQTRALLSDASRFCSPHCLRCVDVEGGSVNRLRDALAPLPPAQAVADAMRARRQPALAREHGELVARAVAAFGFNTSLAPVLDLGLPESAEVMGSRTAGETPREVIEYAKEFFTGLEKHGVAGCGKHFPGLGGGGADTHQVTPAIARTWDQLWSEDLLPYRELHRTMPMVMVNHAAYPATAGKERPASVSPFWMTTVLRRRIGYRGIIFSDDFEMGGILKFLPIEEAVIAALRAGMDMIEICHSSEMILRAFESFIAEGERSASFRALLFERANSVKRKRARMFAKGMNRALIPKQVPALQDRMLRFNELISADEAAGSRRKTAVETA